MRAAQVPSDNRTATEVDELPVELISWCLHAVAILADAPEGDGMPASALAGKASVPFVAQVLIHLTDAGIVQRVPFKQGRYRLARPARATSALFVAMAVIEDKNLDRGRDDNCAGPCRVCALRPVLSGRASPALGSLATVFVSDLVPAPAVPDPNVLDLRRSGGLHLWPRFP